MLIYNTLYNDTYVYTYIYIYTYIHIVCIYVYTHICIYIYVYRTRRQGRAAARAGGHHVPAGVVPVKVAVDHEVDVLWEVSKRPPLRVNFKHAV